MGYRIIYGKNKRSPINRKKLLTIATIVGIILLVAAWFDNGLQQLPEAALENMVDAVQNGEALGDAITAFCREIITSAQNAV